MGVLPIALPRLSAAATVASDVSRPRVISTRGMTGTGLKKCMPMKRSGRCVTAAMRVIGIEDVLLARMVCGRQTPSSRLKRSRLASKLSVIASTTKSARPAASSDVVG